MQRTRRSGSGADGSGRSPPRASRRRLLAGLGTAGVAGLAGLAGCATGRRDSGDGDGFLGSGPGSRALAGTPVAELPALSGELTVYSGRGEFLIGRLMQAFREEYPDLELNVRYGSAAGLANAIRTEGSNTPADVFFTVNAGVLGLLATEGRLRSLPSSVLSAGREGYQDPEGRWIGTSGRVRTVPYNTDALSADDIPDDVLAFPELDRFEDAMGWAPTYGSFQGFITVMRVLNGPERTRRWLEGMRESGIGTYSDEFRVAQAVADGEIDAGFANHYYTIRVLDGRPDAPIELGFTENDAGSFFNVAGAGVVDATDSPDRAANFVRHLLSAEAQDYFVRSATFEYPMIPGLEPIDRLPSFEELDPPDLPLTEFARADINETIDLMESAGVL